jgi:phosphoesterase RecJ-like protein
MTHKESTAVYPSHEVLAVLEQFDTVSILTHINPDADTLGTGLGIYNLLRQDRNKKVEIVNVSQDLPNYLDFLPGYDRIKKRLDFSGSLIISCDCGSADRLGIDISGRTVINIDHHASNENYGTLNVVVPDAASASEVAYKLFRDILPVNAEAATCFYAALFSDTRYFTTSSVNAEVFAVAKALVDLGVKPDEVAYHFTQRRSLASLCILEKALSHLQLHQDARVASMYVTREEIESTGARIPDMEGIVDYARSLATVEIGIFAMELDDGIRVSLRSKHVDVSKVAKAFGGGGHKVASGFTLKQCKIDESMDTILSKIDELGLLNEA